MVYLGSGGWESTHTSKQVGYLGQGESPFLMPLFISYKIIWFLRLPVSSLTHFPVLLTCIFLENNPFSLRLLNFIF